MQISSSLRAWPRVAVWLIISLMIYAGTCQHTFDGSSTTLQMQAPSGDSGTGQAAMDTEDWMSTLFTPPAAPSPGNTASGSGEMLGDSSDPCTSSADPVLGEVLAQNDRKHNHTAAINAVPAPALSQDQQQQVLLRFERLLDEELEKDYKEVEKVDHAGKKVYQGSSRSSENVKAFVAFFKANFREQASALGKEAWTTQFGRPIRPGEVEEALRRIVRAWLHARRAMGGQSKSDKRAVQRATKDLLKLEIGGKTANFFRDRMDEVYKGEHPKRHRRGKEPAADSTTRMSSPPLMLPSSDADSKAPAAAPVSSGQHKKRRAHRPAGADASIGMEEAMEKLSLETKVNDHEDRLKQVEQKLEEMSKKLKDTEDSVSQALSQGGNSRVQQARLRKIQVDMRNGAQQQAKAKHKLESGRYYQRAEQPLEAANDYQDALKACEDASSYLQQALTHANKLQDTSLKDRIANSIKEVQKVAAEAQQCLDRLCTYASQLWQSSQQVQQEAKITPLSICMQPE